MRYNTWIVLADFRSEEGCLTSVDVNGSCKNFFEQVEQYKSAFILTVDETDCSLSRCRECCYLVILAVAHNAEVVTLKSDVRTALTSSADMPLPHPAIMLMY